MVYSIRGKPKSEENGSGGAFSLYQFKITLKEIRPPIWRRFWVPDWITLSDLHDIIQVVMGWDNSHLHEFLWKGKRYGAPASDWGFEEVINEDTVTLRKLGLSPKNKIQYEYDFGDSWEHELLLEKILPGEEGSLFPFCLKGARACPPEDSGGVWGYEEVLEILKDPDHEEYRSLKEWFPREFDPEYFDVERINQSLSSIKLTPVPSRKERKKT